MVGSGKNTLLALGGFKFGMMNCTTVVCAFLIIISLYNYLVYLDVFVLSGDGQNNRFIFTAIIPTRSNYCIILGYHTN
jgi:hypothetical protein